MILNMFNCFKVSNAEKKKKYKLKKVGNFWMIGKTGFLRDITKCPQLTNAEKVYIDDNFLVADENVYEIKEDEDDQLSLVKIEKMVGYNQQSRKSQSSVRSDQFPLDETKSHYGRESLKFSQEVTQFCTNYHEMKDTNETKLGKKGDRYCLFESGRTKQGLLLSLMEDTSSLNDNVAGSMKALNKILSHLDAKSLCSAELVCKEWYRVISEGMLWKKLIERMVRTNNLWHGFADRRGWGQYLFKPRRGEAQKDHKFYRSIYPKIKQDIDRLETNWRTGRHTLKRIHCHSKESRKGVYCLQYDDLRIVSGLRDKTIKIWDRNSLECMQVLTGHTGSVLCLQYDNNIIISGSSDTTVRVWDVRTGEMLKTLIHHYEAVLHLRFCDGIMVTCSKDRSIVVWDMQSPTKINMRRVLVGHRTAVNVVDFDDKYIVSASADKTIKVWSTSACKYVRTLIGHKRVVACLQYRDRLVVSGSADNSIRLWDIECGKCLRVLEGHEELVRCIRFDKRRIVSGAYDGKIKVWDLAAALDTQTPTGTLCIKTLDQEHSGRVFRLEFDEFQIVSSSLDDTILVWDFLNVPVADTSACPPSSNAYKFETKELNKFPVNILLNVISLGLILCLAHVNKFYSPFYNWLSKFAFYRLVDKECELVFTYGNHIKHGIVSDKNGV